MERPSWFWGIATTLILLATLATIGLCGNLIEAVRTERERGDASVERLQQISQRLIDAERFTESLRLRLAFLETVQRESHVKVRKQEFWDYLREMPPDVAVGIGSLLLACLR